MATRVRATSMGLAGGPQSPRRSQATLKPVIPPPVMAIKSSDQTRVVSQPFQQSLDLRPRSGIPEPTGAISPEAMQELANAIARHNDWLDQTVGSGPFVVSKR